MHPLVAYKATYDLDSMYLHQSIKEPYWANFLTAMLQEVTDQV